MPDQNMDPKQESIDRDNQLSAILIQLRSQRPSDILRGMTQVRHWLQANLEDGRIYEILLDAVHENRNIREQVRSLLIQMKEKGSKAAEGALSILPSTAQDLLADADDAYYAAEYDQAIQLYRQVLRLAPDDERAKDHLAKAEIKRIAGETDKDLPRAALQYYRRARSHIAARDFLTAIKLLSAAIEEAQAKGLSYPDAEEALNAMQDLLTADEFRRKANYALSQEQWKAALDFYNQALSLDPTNVVMKKEFDSLQNLLRAESELRRRGILKIFTPLGKLWGASEAARGIMPPDNRLLNFIENRLNQIKMIRIGGVVVIIIGILLFLILSEKFEFLEVHPTAIESTNTAVVNTATVTFTPMSTPTMTATVVTTIPPTATAFQTLVPTPRSVLGYGRLTLNFFPLEEPNGNRIQHTIDGNLSDLMLNRKQFVIVVDSRYAASRIWYKCLWELNGVENEGWILDEYIEFVPPPTPIISPTP